MLQAAVDDGVLHDAEREILESTTPYWDRLAIPIFERKRGDIAGAAIRAGVLSSETALKVFGDAQRRSRRA